MSLVLNESVVLAKTRSQDLKSVLKLNCWGSGIKDASLVRQLVNVEVIGLSCNEITTLEDFAYCPKLRELILRKNNIKNISEVAHLQRLPNLTSLWLGENPCAENTHNYRKVVLKALPNLTVLDNEPVTREELQEIERLGNEIYEEVPYESSHSTGSTGSSGPHIPCSQQGGVDYEAAESGLSQHHENTYTSANNPDLYQSENIYPPTNEPQETSVGAMGNQSTQLNDSLYNNSMSGVASRGPHRSASLHQQTSRCPSSQGSMTTLNGGQYQGWSSSSISHNNNLLPKGGKSRSGNILSAILCLVKELDYVGCEVVQTALHCRMEETSQ